MGHPLFFVFRAFTCGYLPRFVVCTGFADSKHSVDGSLCDKSQALDGPLKRIALRFSFFVSRAFTCGYLPRFVVCTGFADSKHSVDGSLCDKSQALDGPLERIALRFSFFCFQGFHLRLSPSFCCLHRLRFLVISLLVLLYC